MRSFVLTATNIKSRSFAQKTKKKKSPKSFLQQAKPLEFFSPTKKKHTHQNVWPANMAPSIWASTYCADFNHVMPWAWGLTSTTRPPPFDRQTMRPVFFAVRRSVDVKEKVSLVLRNFGFKNGNRFEWEKDLNPLFLALQNKCWALEVLLESVPRFQAGLTSQQKRRSLRKKSRKKIFWVQALIKTSPNLLKTQIIGKDKARSKSKEPTFTHLLDPSLQKKKRNNFYFSQKHHQTHLREASWKAKVIAGFKCAPLAPAVE